MRTGLPIMLFVAVAGFHNAISASLEFVGSNKSLEEKVFEENVTTTQPDESNYAAAHVNVTEDILRTTHMGENSLALLESESSENVQVNRSVCGETEALTYETETKVLEKKDSDDGEREALTVDAGAHIGSDESVDKDSEEDSHTSQQKTEHSEEDGENVRSTEDLGNGDYLEYYR